MGDKQARLVELLLPYCIIQKDENLNLKNIYFPFPLSFPFGRPVVLLAAALPDLSFDPVFDTIGWTSENKIKMTLF